MNPYRLTRWLAALLCLLWFAGCAPGARAASALPAAAAAPAATVMPAGTPAPASFAHAYGVFLSCDASQAERFAPYQTVVIDAAYFTAKDIAALHRAGHTVFTYLNVGSLESFRPYYDRFVNDTLAPYEHWEEERWMDVSSVAWQTFLTDTLAKTDLELGVDGFFIDNCDVYALYPTEAVFNGLSAVLRALVDTGKAVIINGGDVYVDEYARRYGGIADIMTGVNQETVFSAIHFDKGTFSRAGKEDHAYFTAYVERVAALGGKVYLLEYTKNAKLIAEIQAYCRQKGFDCYVSDSVELD
ncbi:MAG TPA: endo alpha-1,4 polygalactosaminidase [Candidatus Limiplasma sp.]|nr:endo alpha-1,4 polygalactosaminidase [Candidatus Limiplasma sp.]HPS81080.1 endo alpha-1,4 polygalactosaminidase [Candidatus Limiplasma sp.]